MKEPRWGQAAARVGPEHAVAAARAALPAAQDARAWAEGEAQSLDQAVALARGARDGASESASPPAGGASPREPGRGGLPGGLTAREAEVLRQVAAGETDRQIAAALVVTE